MASSTGSVRAGSPDRVATPKKRKPKEERWAQILHAAAETFFEKGYDGTSLQEIADRVGILKGSIYYYIATKGDLLGHLLRDAHEKGLENIKSKAEGESNPVRRLAMMIRAHVEFVCRDRARSAVFLHERKRLSTEQRKALLGNEHAYSELFEQTIVDAQKSGLILSTLDHRLAAACMLGSLNSVYQWWRPNGPYKISAIADHFVAGALSGLTTEKGLDALAD